MSFNLKKNEETLNKIHMKSLESLEEKVKEMKASILNESAYQTQMKFEQQEKAMMRKDQDQISLIQLIGKNLKEELQQMARSLEECQGRKEKLSSHKLENLESRVKKLEDSKMEIRDEITKDFENLRKSVKEDVNRNEDLCSSLRKIEGDVMKTLEKRTNEYLDSTWKRNIDAVYSEIVRTLKNSEENLKSVVEAGLRQRS